MTWSQIQMDNTQ